MSSPTIADRADIHKSCKAVEVVVNLLNDYCDAVTAIVAIQKKLAKAIRDASSVKNTNEIAANALNACATVVESLIEVDTKFTKLADKECDTLSADVKRWFKTLAKEERLHDMKLANANGKIKQAGQVYEKKVKKNPASAADEHAKYISLLGTVGPEISQEKHQHSTSIYQQHTTTLANVAVCVCRIAEAEWLRACEEVRKVAPNIGRVGQWKAFGESGWTNGLPGSLPYTDERPLTDTTETTLKLNSADGQQADPEAMLSSPLMSTPAPEYASRAGTPAEHSPSQPPTYLSPQKSPTEKHHPSESEETRDRSQSLNSIASLGSFPSPPNHFPIPRMPGTAAASHVALNDCEEETPVKSTQDESPAPEKAPSNNNENTTFLEFNSPPTSPTTARHVNSEHIPSQPKTKEQESHDSVSSGSQSDKPPVSPLSSAASSSTSSALRTSQIYKRGDYINDGEFGVRKVVSPVAVEGHRSPSPRNALDRRDTNRSAGSVVRDRYARSTAPASPPPKDIPRLPLSVSNLANRYESVAEAQDARYDSRTSVEDQRRTSADTFPQGRNSPVTPRSLLTSAVSYSPATAGPSEDEIARRRQRIRELEELELREQEHELRQKEREIGQRTRELERDRQRLSNVREYRNESPTQALSERLQLQNTSTVSLYDSPSGPPVTSSRHPYASNPNQLPPPMNQRFPSHQSTNSQPASPMSSSVAEHSESCGCEACSVSKYNPPLQQRMRHVPSSQSLRPPESLAGSRPKEKTEKPKAWIRRLSMPAIANALSNSSDSKKGISNTSFMNATNYRNSLVTPDEDGRMRGPGYLDSPKNRSTTNLVKR